MLDYRHVLVKPNEEEQRLNQPAGKKKLPVNAEKQVVIALDAFLGNDFFVLVDDVRTEGLDDRIIIKPETIELY